MYENPFPKLGSGFLLQSDMKKSNLVRFHQELGKQSFLNNFKVEPGTKPGNFDIAIKRYFTDVDGTVIDKNTVAANLQTRYPYYMFGKFDFDGGYRYGLQSVPPLNNIVYLYSFVVAREFQFLLSFSGFNNLNGNLQPGDIVHLFTDDRNAPSTFIWIVVSIPQKSYAGILNNMNTGKYKVRNLKMMVNSGQESNFNIPITTAFINPLSEPEFNYIQPNAYRTAFQYQAAGVPDAQANIRVKMQLSQFLGLYSYISFENDLIQFQFDVEYKLLYISELENLSKNGK